MKQLLKYTTSLLRTVLLLAAMIFVNTQNLAQTAEQLAAMPNAFQTVTPTINDGQYYYIQFYYNGVISYLTDRGVNKRASTADFMPSNNRLWTLEGANDGDNTHFKLKSKSGYYIGYAQIEGASGSRYASLNADDSRIAIFKIQVSEDGYNLFDINNKYVNNNTNYDGLLGRYDNIEWSDNLSIIRNDNSGKQNSRMHFVKLKDNVAYIIYYREGDNSNLNSAPDAIGPNHYMTYSMTDSPDDISSGLFTTTQQIVSSRKSITGNTKESWNLPTAAAYHKDGLWTIEKTGEGDNFQIRKYGTYDYLNRINATRKDGFDTQIYSLDNTGNRSTFTFTSPDNNRYSSIRNVNSTNYLNYADGDGWYVLDWDDPAAYNTWQAGFLPVEVPNPNQDDYYGVLLKVKRTDNRIKLIGQTNNPTITPYGGSTLDNLYGATFTPTADFTNVFQFKNMPTGCYTKIVIRFGSPVPDRWHIHTYGGQFDNNVNLSGLTEYEVNLNGNPISDFTIFNWGTMEPITITECYFYPENPNCELVEMLNYEGGTDVYSEQSGVRKLWHLEQVDDYGHFRLKNPDGEYFQADGVVTDDVNNAKIFTNTSLLEKFDVKWYYFDPAVKEIPVNHKITHKTSYLQQYAKAGLDKQGLATDADSDWKNADGTQKVNLFEITHYVKQGNSLTVEFPTVLNYSNDHVYYQRFYHYNDETCDNGTSPDGTDINGLKDHVSLDVAGIGDVQYYLYSNGIVTGEKLNWEGIYQGSFARKAIRSFKFTNSDGKDFTVAADVSRYSDFKYLSNGDLEEPSLTMRYLYYMKDAKVMARKLTGYPEQAGVENKNVWKETGTVCTDESKWMETKEFHFPATPLPYENDKWAGYRGEFIGLRHLFSDYWVFNDGNASSTDDNNLVSAVNGANNGGNIEVRIYDPNNTGIRLGGWNPNINLKGTVEGYDEEYQGFYFYDKVARNQKTQYGDSRFIVFRYPKDNNGKATTVTVEDGKEKKAYLHVYLNNNGTRYQLAQFTVIFDENSDTRPWTSVNNSAQVKDTDRDPEKLRERAGRPIAKITFDYPVGETYHYPASTADGPLTRHDGVDDRYGTIGNSSPIPLKFDNTNYAFDGDGCNWGSYAMVTTKNTQWGNSKLVKPADADIDNRVEGYGIESDANLQSAFLYIDASEQPGDICSADFQGEFCSGDKLMCSGWISGSNRYSDNVEYRCPGGITLTVKGERIEDGVKETIYRFCPGQCYELDNGTGVDGSGGSADKVVWQQFYFEFGTTQKYKRYWMEVNNNCVSSNGGDFMLDNVEVFALVPEVIPEMNTPVCVNKDVSEMQLLKLNIGFDKIIAATSSTEVTDGSAGVKKDISFVFLEKDKFLAKFLEELNKDPLNYGLANVDALEKKIEKGEYENLITTDANYKKAYKEAFNAAVLGDINKVWDSDSNTENLEAAVLNYHWSTKFSEMTPFSFAKAVNGQGSVFRETDAESSERFIVINGNYPNKLKWKTDTEYYVIPYQSKVTSITDALYQDFNICSACCKKTEFRLDPPIEILSMEASDVTEELVVCEGKIPTLLTDLKGMTINGEEVPLKNLNFDWWLGDPQGTPQLAATLVNYHTQHLGGVYLDQSLSYLRSIYPDATTLEGLAPKSPLTQEMLEYLQELVDKGQLILHQKSVSVPAAKTSAADPYVYLVACPIHDASFDQSLRTTVVNGETEIVRVAAYFCDEPQEIRVRIGEKAPSLKCGFVPGENGFASYDYVGDPVLSVRLANREQFEMVKHGEPNANTIDTPTSANAETTHFLWLPIRNALVQSDGSERVIQKSGDVNIYLASTNDPVWDKAIYAEMKKNVSSLPIVGKIVQLNAIDASTPERVAAQNGENSLCVYFTENFDVREGYTYTLSLPFQESPGKNTCDGTLLLNLKIVPDYEVWTGGADNTDWNNDQNWRRADGNLGTSTEESSNGAGLNNNELYVSSSLPTTSGLYDYTTNYTNYRTAKDRLLRKGFAPLYCTHILLKGNEWGDAPQLYDALNGKSALTNAPFPNLSEDVIENYTVTSYGINERFTSLEAVNGKLFAIVNENEGKVIYGTTNQNLGYDDYATAYQPTNSVYYFKLESGPNGYFLLRAYSPNGNPYDFYAWSSWHYNNYLNSQLLTATDQVSFILGLNNQNGQDGENLALWNIEESNGKFTLRNVGTGKYLKDNTVAKYDEPTYFTFCTLKDTENKTRLVSQNNILKFDMQARKYDIWSETYGSEPTKGRAGDLIAEMYQINSCDEVALQPTAELLNAHLLNYNSAWMEYQLDMNRWYLLGSALQGTIAGEWYAPTGTAQQKTTYYEDVKFGAGYDRYSPAIYQRSWDKAKAVLYEVGSEYDKTNDPDDSKLGSAKQGTWSGTSWNDTGADDYLDRLGYKPLGNKKANVAIKGIWSNTYNDATVDYSKGAFSVLVKNDLKGGSNADPAIIRLPKEDTMYDYYEFSQTGAANGGTDTNLSDVRTLNRAKNRGRLKTDLLLPISDTSLPLYQKIQRTELSASRYGDQRTYTRVPTQAGSNALPMTLRSISESVSAGISNLGYYLVENPFPCGLNMNEFFATNTGLKPKYWLITTADAGQSPRQQLVQQAPTGEWITPNGDSFSAIEAVVAPGQGFFVQASTAGESTNITFTDAMQAQTRFGKKTGSQTFNVVVGTKQQMQTVTETVDGQTVTYDVPVVDEQGNYVVADITEDIVISNYVQDTGDGKEFPLKSRTRGDDDTDRSLGLVITAQRGVDESNALVMLRDEASNEFLPDEDTETFITSDLEQVPTVYTLCGRLATTINSIHDFRSLSIGVESNSDAPCTLTFQGVELLGDSVSFYDAVERKLTPLESGMQIMVSGQTQNRYYLVRGLNQKEAAEETHLQIFTEGLTAKVIASTEEPIVIIRCFDTAGRLIYSAEPQTSEHSFTLPRSGIYIIEAQTENDRKTKKVMTR